MKRLVLFILAVGFLMVFLSLFTIFLPSKVTVSKSVSVNAGMNLIKEQLENFDNWKNWHPLFKNKNITVSITQNKDTSYATLTNEKQQKVSFILEDTINNNINLLLDEDGKINNSYQFILVPNGSSNTQLTWNVNTYLGWYPWKKLGGIFLDKIRGPQYEVVLENLKNAVETSPR